MNKIAFVFPGQGSQKIGMGKDLMENYPEANILINRANKALKKNGVDIGQICFEGPEEELKNTVNAQPAILTISTILCRLLRKNKIKPSIVAGHSLGEYSALVASSAIKFEDAVKLVRKRGEYMQKATATKTGSMLAIIGLEKDEISKICEEINDIGIVEIANHNSPSQVVVSGEIKALEKLSIIAKENLARYLDKVKISNPKIPISCNVSAEYINNKEEIRSALIQQMTHPVNWVDTILKMKSEGINQFIEVGPGKVLKGLIKQIFPESKVFNVFDSNSLQYVIKKMGEVL